MNDLTPRDSEVVALASAIGSNCVPCIEHHIPEARKAGLDDSQITAAIRLADRVRQVPARKVLDPALRMLNVPVAEVPAGACGASRTAATADTGGPCCG